MAKLITLFLVLIALNVCLLLYHDTPTTTSLSNPASWTNMTNFSQAGSSPLWAFVSDPTQWANTNFLLVIFAIAGSIALIGGLLLSGVGIGVKTDTIIFASMVPGLVAIGATFANLYMIIQSEISSRIFGGICTTGTCVGASLVVAAIIGPIAFYYVWTVVEWWRGKDF